MRYLRILFVVLMACASPPVFAQATYSTPAGSRVNGVVPLTCDGAGANCVPGTGSGSAGGAVVAGDVDDTAGAVLGQTVNARNYVFDGAAWDRQPGGTGAADGTATAIMGGVANARGYVFNGTTWDRMRGDTSGAYSVTVPSAATAAGTDNVLITAAGVTGGSYPVKGSSGNIYGYNVVSITAGYVMLLDSAAVSNGPVVPTRCLPIAANTGVEVSFRGMPVRINNFGMSLVFSSTGCFTLTLAPAAFLHADAK